MPSPDAPNASVKMSDEYGGFALLNLFDLGLTALIFQHGGREINPVGYHVMVRFGLSGYTLFKFALVGAVILACERIYAIKPESARRLINSANLIYLGVVLWECVLIAFH
jgi:class 3 adenylate cyclase